MANQTVTTSVNYDDAAISGLLNGETIFNNGGSVTIDSDVRWNQQAAVMGTIQCSATLGGSVLVDGTTVWELFFSASTGNVPTQGALGTNGVTGGTSGATGELLRVWTTGTLTPTAAGGAMPVTGWVKLRSKVGTFQAGEIVTLPGGATITLVDAGKRSWLHIVGSENQSIVAARISGTCSMTGDWYELGTTDGTDDQTFQFPVADWCSAIQIETAVGSGVYEWWLLADSTRWGTATQYVATDVRGKYFGMVSSTGVITIARRATNACGFKPVSGLKVRIPNLICSNSNSTNWNANTLSTTFTLRYRGINLASTVASGTYDKICSNWYPLAIGDSLTITDSSVMAPLVASQITGTYTASNIAIGCAPVSFANPLALNLTGCATINISNIRVTKRENDSSADCAVQLSTCANITVSNIQAELFGATGSAVRIAASSLFAFQLNRCGSGTVSNTTVIGGSLVFNSSSDAMACTDLTFADALIGSTQATVSRTAALSMVTSKNLTFTGPINWFGGLSNVQPSRAVVTYATVANDSIVQNVGSSSSPLDLGGNTEFFFIGSDSENCIVRRCYAQNSAGTGTFYNVGLTVINFTVDNCASDYADLQQLTGVRSRIRGLKNGRGAATASGPGTHIADLFTSATAGTIVFAGADIVSGFTTLVLSGGSGLGTTGGGSIIMPNLSDTAIWEMDYFALGHTALANTDATVTGTNTGNFSVEFQFDTGSGFNGTWLSATGANLSGIGAINPATGIKLKVRATVTTASTTNAIQFVQITTVTTSSAQDTLYPFPFDGLGDIDNLIAGSRIQIYNNTTSTQLDNVVVAGTSYSYDYYVGTQISVGDTVRVRVTKLGYLPQTILAIATSTGFLAVGNQQTDSIYVTNGIDGSTVTEFTADYPNIDLDINDPDQVTSVQRVYAFLRYTETTQSGIEQWFDVVDPTDEVNYEIDATKLNLKFDNTQPTPVVIDGGRIYRSDGATIIEATSGSIQMDPQRVYQSSQAFTADELADTVLRRSTANVEASVTGDPISLKSLYGMVAQGVHNTQVTGATLTVTRSNDVTVLGTRTVTIDPTAKPIIGIDSD